MNRLLCIWLPNWPIQRRRHQQVLESNLCPEEKNELDSKENNTWQLANHAPILIWGEHQRRGRRVLACCPKARSAGVRIGMPVAQASELCVNTVNKLCPGNQGVDKQTEDPQVDPHSVLPRVLSHDAGEDLEALQQLAEKFHHQISPLVAIETIDKKPWSGYPRHQSESLMCEISGIAHLYGGEAELLTSVTQMLDSMGLAARMAIADHQATAWAVAHGMTDQIRKTVTRSQDPLPPRCTIVPTQVAGGTPDSSPAFRQNSVKGHIAKAFIEPLCVTALRIDETTAMSLDRLGIATIGQLLKLPRSGLASRLGTSLVQRLQEVLGELDSPLVVHRVPVEHRETWKLQYPTSDQAILQDRIARLMKKIRAGLATRQRGALRITCRLDLLVHPPLILQIGLFAPTTDVGHLCGLLSTRLETLRLPADVNCITLTVNLSGPIRTTQISLLGDPLENDHQASRSSIGRLVDSLSNRLGRDQVVKVHLRKDPIPETAYRTIPLAGNPTVNKRGGTRRNAHHLGTQHSNKQHFDKPIYHPHASDAMRRPFSLLASPLSLAVASKGGSFRHTTSSTDLPDRFLLHNVAYRVLRSWGPERIETGWWNGPSVRRDYFRIETDQKQWWWIYRDFSTCVQHPGQYRWVLHGRFS